MRIIRPDINIDFIRKQKLGFIFSAMAILICLCSLIIQKGPNYGIDFIGGTIVQIKFSEAVTIGKIRDGLSSIKLKDVSVQEFGQKQYNEYLIRTSNSESGDHNLSAILAAAIKKSTGVTPEIRRVEMVGPQVGSELRKKALLAIFYALLFITIYISYRFEQKLLLSGVTSGGLMTAVYFLSVFEVSMAFLITAALIITLILFWILRLKYAMGAIVALLHDVLITVGIFSVLNLDFSLPIIAALLTIIGYSLNDTIIVFDRIRENIKGVKTPETIPLLFNKSINETLSRTILTSLTTLIVLFALFFLGGEIIHNFAFAMIIGVLTGTYSSIFVASPIVLLANKGQIK